MNNKQKIALSYYLESAVPKGGIACVFFPKKILTSILPDIARKKNCKIMHFGNRETVSFFAGLILHTNDTKQADVIFAEPSLFTDGGGYFFPEEAEHLNGLPVLGVGPLRFTNKNFEDLDFVPLQKTITETGIVPSEILSEEINSSA